MTMAHRNGASNSAFRVIRRSSCSIPSSHEIIRLGAGHEVSQYAAILDAALEDVQPVNVLLQAAGGRQLNGDECRRLAYNSWELDTLDQQCLWITRRSAQVAAAHCPANLSLERARLSIFAAYYAADAESDALDAPASKPSARLVALTDQVAGILAQQGLAVSSADALQILDDSFFKAARARGPKFAPALRDSFAATMDAAANDERYVEADQLGDIDAKLRALKALGGPKDKLPGDAVAAANTRIDAALAAEQNPYVRSGLVNASLSILEDTGQYPKAYQIAKAEMARSGMPYYFEADLADIAEKMGQKDEAVGLLEQAYRESQGTATRFQWGQLYLSGLLRMTPNDSARIEQAGAEVLAELDGPDRIYRRARVRLEKLDRELRTWNDTSKGQHTDVLQSLHARMQEICVKIPEQEPARTSCDAFLNAA